MVILTLLLPRELKEEIMKYCPKILCVLAETELFPGAVSDDFSKDMLAYCAAGEGHLSLLQWLHIEKNVPLRNLFCYSAARAGQLHVLQWLREFGCPWGVMISESAAGGGHLDTLQWLRENDCPWDEMACYVAIRGGHLHVLRWIEENGGISVWDRNKCLFWAKQLGQWEIVEWIKSH